MSDTFKLELSRARALAICICAAGAFILFFVAGTASGLLIASNAVDLPMAQAAPTQPKYEPVPAEKKGSAAGLNENTLEVTGNSGGESGNPPSLAVLSSAPAPASSPAIPAPAASPAQAPAQPVQAPASSNQLVATSQTSDDMLQSPASYGIPLAVKVCSFATEAGANNLASLLESKGYHASIARAFGADDRVWYVVTVGPYREWNAAASAAAHVAIIANVQPVVSQLR